MKHLLDIPELNARAFLPEAGRMRLYGKSDPPPAPDYVGQANATSAGNLEAARAQTTANRMNQVTPYGEIRYTNEQTFDQSGYDAATKKYQDDLNAYNNAVAQRAQNPQMVPVNSPVSGLPQIDPETGAPVMTRGNYGPDPVKPGDVDKKAFYQGNPDKWSSEIILSDTGRQLLDQSNRTSLGLGALQDTAMGRVRETQSTPFDTSGLTDLAGLQDPKLMDLSSQTGMDAWSKASQIIKDRNAGSLNAQQAALDTKLANMGLTAGSEGWGIQQQQFGKQRNDADMAAELAGSQLQNQMFNQALSANGQSLAANGQKFNQALQGNASTLQQRAFLRQMPLNELNALRTGSQVQNPTFSTPGMQGQTSGPDLLGATNSQYQAQVGNVNAQNAATASTNQAAAGVATAALAAFF